MYDARTNLSSQVAAEVRRHLGDAVFTTIIPRSVRLSEAPSHGLPISMYRPDSKGAEAYEALAAEFRARHDHAPRPDGRSIPIPDMAFDTSLPDAAPATDGRPVAEELHMVRS
jgi:chromosome partitioning protein